MTRKLALFAALLAFAVIVLGAYVRLSGAGLGCPDWPGCYGRLSPHHAAEAIAAAQAVVPHGPVSPEKAWKEMLHRYLASALGLLVAVLATRAWLWREPAGRTLPTVLLGLVIVQGLLGMWTVTLLLKPLVVSAHLLGGMATLALLFWLALAGRGRMWFARRDAALRPLALICLILVCAQIALGGWVSTNYAALACPDFPLCQGVWWPEADFARGFTLHRELGLDGNGAPLPVQGLTAIHLVHRLGAVLVLAVVLLLCWRLLRDVGMRSAGYGLLALASTQVLLGIANVVLSLPLPLAVAHNAGAALLLLALVWLNLRLREARS